MNKITTLGHLLATQLPQPITNLLYLGRRETLDGRVMDSKAQAFGRFAKMLRGPDFSPTVEESREQTRKVVKAFDETCPPLKTRRDFVLPGADGDIPARLYCDQEHPGGLSILVYFHGGGFVQGDLETHDGICGKLAKWGRCMVISIDYRLAPEHKFPAGVEDAFAAYDWILKNAGNLGGDPSRVGIGGDSAGGNFSAVVCQQRAKDGLTPPALQVLIYPGLDARMETQSHRKLAEGYILPRNRMEWFLSHYLKDHSEFEDIRVSPVLNPDLSGQPKTLIATGGFDPLRDEGIEYGNRLQENGVQVKQIHYPGQIHAFVNLCRVIPQGNRCLREIADWLKQS